MAKVVKRQDLTFGNQEMIDAMNFGQAFQMARLKAGGAGGVFNWKGKKYTTDYETEDWSPTYPNKKSKGTSAVASPEATTSSPSSSLDESIEDVMTLPDDDYEVEDVEVDEDSIGGVSSDSSTVGSNTLTIPNPDNAPLNVKAKILGVFGGAAAVQGLRALPKFMGGKPKPLGTYSKIFGTEGNLKNTIPPYRGFTLQGESYDPDERARRLAQEEAVSSRTKPVIRPPTDIVSSTRPLGNEAVDVEWYDSPSPRTLSDTAGPRLLGRGDAVILGPGTSPRPTILGSGPTIELGSGLLGKKPRVRKPRARRGK